MAIRMPERCLSVGWGEQSLSACRYASYGLPMILSSVAHQRVRSAHSPAELHFATSASHLRGFPVPRAARTLARGRGGGKDSIGSPADPLTPGRSQGTLASETTRSLLAGESASRARGATPAGRPTPPESRGRAVRTIQEGASAPRGIGMKWLVRFGLALAVAGAQGAWAAPVGEAEPAERSFQVWHGSRPSAWTLLTAPPRRGPPQSAPTMGLSEEISGSKPVLWSLRAAPVGPGPALAPMESFASVCPGTKPVAESLSMNQC